MARRRPISRVRCVTFCQSTPVRPSATIEHQEAGHDRPTIERREREASRRVAHRDASAAPSNDHVGATRLQPLEQPLLERGGRAGTHADDAVLPEAIARCASGRAASGRTPCCVGRRDSPSLRYGRDDADHSRWTRSSNVGSVEAMFLPIGSALPNRSSRKLGVDHHRHRMLAVVIRARTSGPRTTCSPSTSLNSSVTSSTPNRTCGRRHSQRRSSART